MRKLPPIAPALLAWYYEHRRILPFREDPSPYHIWVSEIMLQQTRVTAVLPYYERFMRELPDIPALAACEEQRLHKLWEGLGYYSRARNLQKAAQVVVAQYGGALPADFEKLKALPGIGEYTAGAIASIAFGLPHVAVDGNVLRVFSRLLAKADDISLPATKTAFAAEVQRQQPVGAPGDYNQALMELGALVCLPKTPHCDACPLQGLCLAHERGTAASLPCKAPKKRPLEIPVCVLICRTDDGKILLQQRPASGLLAGLWQPLVLEGAFTQQQAEAALCAQIPGARLQAPLPPARHIFTHRIWKMYGWLCHLGDDAVLPKGFVLAAPAQVQGDYPLPGAFKAYNEYLGKR